MPLIVNWAHLMLNNGASPLSITEYELAMKHLKDWADVPLRRLMGKAGRQMVRERHLKIGRQRGKGAADKTMRGFRAFWNTARREDPDLGESPTINVAWYKLPPRKSALRTHNLEQWGRELEALRGRGRDGELFADFFALMALTGMRKTALANIKRKHVGPPEHPGTIYIARPKGGRTFYLPLSDASWEIVQRRMTRRIANGCSRVRPARAVILRAVRLMTCLVRGKMLRASPSSSHRTGSARHS